jgi:hypothetical protein
MPLVAPPLQLYEDGTLRLVPALVLAYEQQLKATGLFAQVTQKPPQGIALVGGAGLQDTQNHFAYSFSTSAIRGEYVLLDVNDLLEQAPADLLTALSANRVAYLDLAAGAGGGSLGLLTTLAVLRNNNLVPTTPLDLHILAADISKAALDIYLALFGVLQPFLVSSGMNVSLTVEEWDAKQSNNTAALLDKWFAANANAEEYIAIISAISGGGVSLAKSIERSIQHISDRLANYPSTFFFLEPKMKGTKDFLDKLLGGLHLGWFASITGPGLSGNYKWLHPFTGAELTGSIWVSHYRRI